MLTGITASTQLRLLRDAGLVYLNYGLGSQALLGATGGGNKLTITPEIVQEKHDGQPGDVKGDKRIVGVSVKLSVNISEAGSNAVILAAMAAAESAAGSTHNVITRDRQIQAGDYFDNVTLVLEKSGTSTLWYFKLKNALPLSPYELDGKEKERAITTIEFTGHYLVSDLATEPWEIGNPIEGATGFFTANYLAGANGSIIGNAHQTVQSGDDASAVYAAPDTGYEFTQWTDASTDNPRTDTNVLANINQTATFTAT